MKIVLAILVLLVVAGSCYADYKWRQWMAARAREHQSPTSQDSFQPHHRR